MSLKSFLCLACLSLVSSILHSQATITGELKKWHKVTLSWNGPTVSESDPVSPFLNYRLSVNLIAPSGKTWTVPGFFAADGNAGETSVSSGSVWRIHFAPEETGTWNYSVSFRTGINVAISAEPDSGTGTSFDGDSGSFTITSTDKTLPDNRANGRLDYVGIRYLQFQETGTYFLKAGADSPENLLSYDEFDNTDADYTWEAHFNDWNAEDPTWKTDQGKDLIGAINYLHSKGMNVFSFITFNVNGDGDDVWPYAATNLAQMNDMSSSDIDNRTRFDVSKLDQWEILFSHADKLGMYLHFKLQETENDQLLDGGELGLERRLYYREMIARFGHHLALNWNIGEENSQTPAQRIATAQFFFDNDPYKHNTVVHTRTNDKNTIYTPLLGNNSLFTGISMQNDPMPNHEDVKEWIKKSEDSGRPWVVANDEQGPAEIGVAADDGYAGNQGTAADNRDDIRNQVLWGTLMAGGAGVEYYFGSRTGVEDLDGDDFRSRETKWDDAKIALDFFNTHLPFWEMNSSDDLVDSNNMCFSKTDEVYVVYLPDGGNSQLDLSDVSENFRVKWYNPRSGGNLQDSNVTEVNGGSSVSLGNPPSDSNLDWVVLVQVESNKIDITGITLSPETADVNEGDNLQLTATVQPADATNQQINWSSDNNAVATVDANGLVSAISPGTATITATTVDGGFFDTTLITVIEVNNTIAVTGVVLNPETADVNEGDNLQLTATVQPADATNQQINWSSDNNAVATVDANGLVSAISPGTATITATTVDGGFFDTTLITVIEVNNTIAVTGVVLNPETADVNEGDNLQLTATVQPADATNQQINWSSDNNAVATVDANGLVSAISPGTATITATTVDGGFFDTTLITVIEVNNTIAVTGVVLNPETADVNEGDNLQLTATVQPADATNQQINWSSDNNAVATVDANGLVSAISPGTATITATTVDGGFFDTTLITVIEVNNTIAVTGVVLNPETADVNEGDNLQLTATVQPADATNQQINWSSDNNAVATVDANGLVSAISPGTATITATTVDGGFFDTTLITVIEVNNTIAVTGVVLNPETADVNEGDNLQLTATVQPADATNQQINWSSDNNAVATVDANGLVSAISPGTATITATTVDGGFFDTTLITVIEVNNTIAVTGVVLNPETADVNEGDNLQLTATVQPADATNQQINWNSDNNAVATVDANGLVSAMSPGTATITATTVDGGFFDTTLITVIEVNNTIDISFAPNPIRKGDILLIEGLPEVLLNLYLYDVDGKLLENMGQKYAIDGIINLRITSVRQGFYLLYLESSDTSFQESLKIFIN